MESENKILQGLNSALRATVERLVCPELLYVGLGIQKDTISQLYEIWVDIVFDEETELAKYVGFEIYDQVMMDYYFENCGSVKHQIHYTSWSEIVQNHLWGSCSNRNYFDVYIRFDAFQASQSTFFWDIKKPTEPHKRHQTFELLKWEISQPFVPEQSDHTRNELSQRLWFDCYRMRLILAYIWFGQYHPEIKMVWFKLNGGLKNVDIHVLVDGLTPDLSDHVQSVTGEAQTMLAQLLGISTELIVFRDILELGDFNERATDPSTRILYFRHDRFDNRIFAYGGGTVLQRTDQVFKNVWFSMKYCGFGLSATIQVKDHQNQVVFQADVSDFSSTLIPGRDQAVGLGSNPFFSGNIRLDDFKGDVVDIKLDVLIIRYDLNLACYCVDSVSIYEPFDKRVYHVWARALELWQNIPYTDVIC